MIFTPAIHRFFFIVGLAIALCALPFSPFALSVGIITIAVNWLLDGGWKYKLNRFILRKSLWAFLLIYASLIVGFFYSSNIGYAIKELKLWLPLLFLPVVLATSEPIQKGELKLIMILFCSSVLVATIISFVIFIRDYSLLGQNVRYISPFISHIRLALMVNLSIFLLTYMTFQRSYFQNKLVKLSLVLVAVWFVLFLFILQSVSGIVILVLVSTLLLIRWILTLKEPVLKFSVIVVLSFTFLFIFTYFAHTIDKFFTRNNIEYKTLPKTTINGNAYTHDTLRRQFENGNLVWVNICFSELKRGWDFARANHSDKNYKDYKIVEPTLIRYLTSKGLRKDSVGFSKLDSIDIKLIEGGVSSVIFREHKVGIYPRLYQMLWEIDNYNTFGNTNGSTLMQRYIYLKASWQIIKKNILFGVGTGDGKDSLIEYYKTSNVNLEQQYWFISHNQYLTVWIGSGLVGLAIFLFGLFFPVLFEKRGVCLPCLAFFAIMLLSMLSEDTFETHIGVSFCAIFYSIFFFSYDFQKDKIE